MNRTEIARIAHEVERACMAQMPGIEPKLSWEKESPVYRAQVVRLVSAVLDGVLPVDDIVSDSLAPVRAVLRACLPPEPDDEQPAVPDRKPGYNEKDLSRESPALRELRAPGECVTMKAA